jgi:acyl carrier protein
MNTLISKNGRTVAQIVAATFCVAEHKVTLDTVIETDLIADSLDSVELCMKLEKEFGVAIPDSDWEKITDVRSIEELVIKQQGDTTIETAIAVGLILFVALTALQSIWI